MNMRVRVPLAAPHLYDMHTPEQIEVLQGHYLSCRRLLEVGLVAETFAQKAFEEAIGGVLREDAWKPTHISYAAAHAAIKGDQKLQRAHGVIPGRLDRYVRTMSILKSPIKEFDAWWNFFLQNDRTVILTRSEHSSGVAYKESELILLPEPEHQMFTSSGYSFKLRKKKEILWIENHLMKLSS
jgi:hypothetical protein